MSITEALFTGFAILLYFWLAIAAGTSIVFMIQEWRRDQ